jgi:hypothetical protein
MQNPVNAPKKSAPTDAPTAIPTIEPVDKPEDDLISVIFAKVVRLLTESYVGGVVGFFDSCVESDVVVFVAFDVYCVGVTVVLPEVVILVGVVELDEVVFVGVVVVFVEVAFVVILVDVEVLVEVEFVVVGVVVVFVVVLADVEVLVEVEFVVGVVVVFVVGAFVKSALEIQSVSTVIAPRA